ncbi:hypothetical protein ADL22_31070 [Streptomyces sp. NRRL F-4489]|uniref:DUF488 domain-containing protein n=1 Tax=Streptomyces sp. NRRL F-4489 TaxID=1609095 RepID=UPI00074AB720|nr:DUF488 family protein [Streptomyces sp. NRRL F-4489]KUL34123.1 hypothetical protein ADL22_31070 [Streptomyces sp. NRRL F-4489]
MAAKESKKGKARGGGIRVRRAYDPPEPEDGARVLVDRLWPRGLAKEDAQLDEWCKDVAPSAELRKWYGHEEERFAEFAERYRGELAEGAAAAAVERLRELAADGPLTLLTATKEVPRSNAAVLGEVLRGEG